MKSVPTIQTLSTGLLGLFLVSMISSCNSLDDNQKALARETGDAQVKATNDDLELKVARLRKEFDTRHAFYQALSGTFEGRTPYAPEGSKATTLYTKIVISPTLPANNENSVTTYEEQNAKLLALALNVQIVQEPDTGRTMSCTFSAGIPDLTTGIIHLSSSTECPNAFTLWITPNALVGEPTDSQLVSGSSAIAASIQAKLVSQVSAFEIQEDLTQSVVSLRFAVAKPKSEKP